MYKKLVIRALTLLIVTAPVCLFASGGAIDWKLLNMDYMRDEKKLNEIADMGEGIIPELFGSFESSYGYGKANIIEILARMSGEESKKAMVEILKVLCTQPLSGRKWMYMPEEEFFKEYSIYYLAKTGDTGLAAIREGLIGAEGEFRKCLIIGTGYMGDSTYYDSIVKILEADANPYLRALSARTLGKIGDRKAIPKLEKALKDDFYHIESGATPGSNLLLSPEMTMKRYPVREAANSSLRDMGVKVGRKWEDMWIEKDKTGQYIIIPSPGLTNKPTPPGQEKKQ